MKRTLLTLAIVAAAGAAGAQTVTPPSIGPGTVTTPPVNPGTVTTPGITPPSATTPDIAKLPAANAEGSAAARARIEADGYSNVQGLTRGPDGKWRGQATRGNARVGVVVDANGRVVTE